MSNPTKMSNDVLAIALELWLDINCIEGARTLTEEQEKYFREIIWRLRLMSDVVQGDINEQ